MTTPYTGGYGTLSTVVQLLPQALHFSLPLYDNVVKDLKKAIVLVRSVEQGKNRHLPPPNPHPLMLPLLKSFF